MENHGKLYFKYGCMGAGKSLQLLATAHNFQEHGIPFLTFKSEIDTRDGENTIYSRALGGRECVSISITANLFEIIGKLIDNSKVLCQPQLKWILVDEAQFLTKEQVNQLAAIVDNFGISVICYGLRTDFRTELFPGSKRLFEIADDIEELKSSCFCNSKTIFNARINGEGKVITEGAQVEVGGDDRYVSLCRKCYNKKIGNPYYNNKIENEN